jgi:F0F1-type ATP synthase assembly protein I
VAGAVTGLVAGLMLEAIVEPSTPALRWVQLVFVGFGAAVAAWVYEGAKATNQGREPTKPTYRRRLFRWRPR